MKTDPKYPYRSPEWSPIVNAQDPILKPWAAEHMPATNEEVLSRKKAFPFTSQARC